MDIAVHRWRNAFVLDPAVRNDQTCCQLPTLTRQRTSVSLALNWISEK
jgi:hypothetical protein